MTYDWIALLDSDDCDVPVISLDTTRIELVVDHADAVEHTLHLRAIPSFLLETGIIEHLMEVPIDELADRARRDSQVALGRHHDERLAVVRLYLSTQHVECLRRR